MATKVHVGQPIFSLSKSAKELYDHEQAVFSVQPGESVVYVIRIKDGHVEFEETVPISEARQIYENYIEAGFRLDKVPDGPEELEELVDYELYFDLWSELSRVTSDEHFSKEEPLWSLYAHPLSPDCIYPKHLPQHFDCGCSLRFSD